MEEGNNSKMRGILDYFALDDSVAPFTPDTMIGNF